MPKNGMRARMARRQRRRQWNVRNVDSFPRLMDGLRGAAAIHDAILHADYSQIEVRAVAHAINETPVDPSLTTGRISSPVNERGFSETTIDLGAQTITIKDDLTSEEKTRLRRQRQNEKRKQERAAARAQKEG